MKKGWKGLFFILLLWKSGMLYQCDGKTSELLDFAIEHHEVWLIILDSLDVLQDFELKCPRKSPLKIKRIRKPEKKRLSNGKLGEMSFQFRGRDKKWFRRIRPKVFEGISHGCWAGKLPTLMPRVDWIFGAHQRFGVLSKKKNKSALGQKIHVSWHKNEKIALSSCHDF